MCYNKFIIVILGDITRYEETFFVIGASEKDSAFVSLYNGCMHFVLLRYLLSDFGKSNAAIDLRQRKQQSNRHFQQLRQHHEVH